MNIFVKSLLAVGITTALSASLFNQAHAATYELIDKGEVTNLKYTYAQHQNIHGDMAISGTDFYNFPVQFSYFDDQDYDDIESYVYRRYLSVNGLNDIEDSDALRAGDPTANDLAWVVRWLQDTSGGKGSDMEYQKVGNTAAMTNTNGQTSDYKLFDETFDDGNLTRSTTDIVSGITDSGISYGTATGPYLPTDVFTDADGVEHTYWLRDFGMRGFFSYDLGAQVFEVVPFETQYAGGRSAVLDVNESGTAVGFSSYKVTAAFENVITNDSGGCADPDIVPAKMSYEACIAQAELQATTDIYHTMAFKATLDPSGNPVVEQLGLLVTPNPEDERPYSSYALAINSKGVAVGFADGFNDESVTDPDVNERRDFQYAVMFKNGEVIDLSGEHTSQEAGSRAYDINDSGIAVGHITKAVNGKAVNKFFYIDTNADTENLTMINPTDYFSGSDSTARAINNAGLIVGEGEIETQNESSQNPRRTAAFVYDMNDDVFSNLNDLIPCSLKQTYNILEARGINDGGMISATAVVKTERRDAKGNVMLDDSGTPLTEDVVRAISLNPIPDDGEVCTPEEEGKVVRKGASIGFTGTWLLIAILAFRRKFMH